MEFDAFELCTSELQEKLTPMRLRFKELEDAQLEETLKHKNAEKSKKEEEEKPKTKIEPYWFPNGECILKKFVKKNIEQISLT